MAKSTGSVILVLVLCATHLAPAVLAQATGPNPPDASAGLAAPSFPPIPNFLFCSTKGGSATLAGSCTPQYTIVSGDLLSSIAANQGITLSALEAANPQIVDFNSIFPGQKLTVPCPGTPSTSALPVPPQPPTPVTSPSPVAAPPPPLPPSPPASPIVTTPESQTTPLQQAQKFINVSATCAPPVGQVAMGSNVLNAAIRYPYIVSLRTTHLPGATALNPVHYCGGTLIAENLVLTAAHCILESPKQGDAIGAYYPNYNGTSIATDFPTAVIGATCTKGPGTASAPVTATILHPKYNGDPLMGYDIGIMQLGGNGLSPPIMPLVQLDSPEMRFDLPNTAIPTGDTTTLLGYGITVTRGGSEAPSLKEATLQIQPDSVCSLIFPNAYLLSQLCTSQPGTSSCSGDSGGPLILQKDDNPANDVQVGIVSYGPPLACGGSNPYSVFTRVASFNAASTSVMPTADTPNQSPIDNFIGGHISGLGVKAPGQATGR